MCSNHYIRPILVILSLQILGGNARMPYLMNGGCGIDGYFSVNNGFRHTVTCMDDERFALDICCAMIWIQGRNGKDGEETTLWSRGSILKDFPRLGSLYTRWWPTASVHVRTFRSTTRFTGSQLSAAACMRDAAHINNHKLSSDVDNVDTIQPNYLTGAKDTRAHREWGHVICLKSSV